MSVARSLFVSALSVLALSLAVSADAQDRSVGRRGVKSLSMNLSLSAERSSEPTYEVDSRGNVTVTEGSHWSGDYQSFLEVGRFVTDHLVLDGGVNIMGRLTSSEIFTSINAGARYYLTPSAVVSPYVSGGGGVFVTHLPGITSNAGTVFGAAGLESAVRDNATVFFEGILERRFYSGAGQNTVRAAVGLRVLF